MIFVVAIRPSQRWRQRVADESIKVASGALDPAEAYTSQLFPPSLLDATDSVLLAFEADVAGIEPPDDVKVMDAVQQVVLELNRVNEEHDGAGYETEEREQLCAYIDDMLGEAGIDVAALAERQGISRHEITDEWREW